MKCVLLLSDKSSGSSALQQALTKHPDLRTVNKTRHFYSETLYWNKAAALLDLPQEQMEYSELPMGRDQAQRDLLDLLSHNIPGYQPPEDRQKLVFEGWRQLCDTFAPCFFEKSPHHLHYRSALELLEECGRQHRDIDFRYIGLVRNPVDTLYSMWTRWSAIPERRQFEWLRAYRNLLDFQQRVGEQLMIIRYEDLVSNREVLRDLCRHIGIHWRKEMGSELHARSRQKWRNDRLFGFQPDPQVITMAQQLGYAADSLSCPQRILWPVYRGINEWNFRLSSGFRRLKRHLRRMAA